MPAEVRYIHEGEWAQITRGGGLPSLFVYPREDSNTYSIGRPEYGTVSACRDLDEQVGFENMQAAVDQALWLAAEPELLRRLW